MYYFVINAYDFNPTNLTNCSLYNSLEDLYEAVCQLEDLDHDEIEGNEITFTQDQENLMWLEIDSRGCSVSIANIDSIHLYQYLSNYEL